MNAVYQCNHANLHVEQRMVVFKANTNPLPANFIVCSNTSCKAVLAYVPPKPKAPTKPKAVNQQPIINSLQKKIDELEAQLAKCRNGQG